LADNFGPGSASDFLVYQPQACQPLLVTDAAAPLTINNGIEVQLVTTTNININIKVNKNQVAKTKQPIHTTVKHGQNIEFTIPNDNSRSQLHNKYNINYNTGNITIKTKGKYNISSSISYNVITSTITSINPSTNLSTSVTPDTNNVTVVGPSITLKVNGNNVVTKEFSSITIDGVNNLLTTGSVTFNVILYLKSQDVLSYVYDSGDNDHTINTKDISMHIIKL